MAVPSWKFVETSYRFLIWETIDGTVTKRTSSGSWRGFDVAYKVNGKNYTIESSVGSQDLPNKYQAGLSIHVLVNPNAPHIGVVKYRFGQFHELALVSIVFGVFAFLLNYFMRHQEKKGMLIEKVIQRQTATKRQNPTGSSRNSNIDLKNDPYITQLIQSGNKIEAIKYLRATFGLSLKEAKSEVDSYQSN